LAKTGFFCDVIVLPFISDQEVDDVGDWRRVICRVFFDNAPREFLSNTLREKEKKNQKN